MGRATVRVSVWVVVVLTQIGSSSPEYVKLCHVRDSVQLHLAGRQFTLKFIVSVALFVYLP